MTSFGPTFRPCFPTLGNPNMLPAVQKFLGRVFAHREQECPSAKGSFPRKVNKVRKAGIHESRIPSTEPVLGPRRLSDPLGSPPRVPATAVGARFKPRTPANRLHHTTSPVHPRHQPATHPTSPSRCSLRSPKKPRSPQILAQSPTYLYRGGHLVLDDLSRGTHYWGTSNREI